MGDWIPDPKPSWWDELGAIVRTLSGKLDTLKRFLTKPGKYIRGFIVGFVLSAIKTIISPIFRAIEIVFLGTAPGTFGAPSEQYGFADLPVVLANIVATPITGLVGAVSTALKNLIKAAVPQAPGPVDGVAMTLVVVVLAVGFVRVGLPLLRAALEAIPLVGGPLSTLLGKL